MALILFSGGVDSQIAKLLIEQQNIPYELITFKQGFNDRDLKNIKKFFPDEKITFIDISDRFIKERLFNPKYNYGKGFNPCRDCHELMTIVAWEYGLDKYGLDNFFLVSGEVVGQRPNSQRFDTMKKKNPSLMEKYLVRPLSAKVLPPTIPEERGWIDREKLLGIVGRSRKPQIEIIEKHNLKFISSVGCWLAQKDVKQRMKNLKRIFGDTFTKEDIIPMRYGRHFKLSDNDVLVVSRNEFETNKVLAYKGEKFIILKNDLLGPSGLLTRQSIDNEDIVKKSFEIILAYSKGTEGEFYTFDLNGKKYTVQKKIKKNLQSC